jgi:dipeptidyl aminopeptidase/acylaminoacyl peptidase
MFGPYNLITFLERIPETWKPYYSLVLGKPDDNQDLEFLIDRSPSTFIDRIECPLLVIQGRNDPRVVASESLDMVEHLRSIGKDVEYFEFENEGHDVLKLTNRVTCYNRINSFFVKHLRP